MFKQLRPYQLKPESVPSLDELRKVAQKYPARECEFQETQHLGFKPFEGRENSDEAFVLNLDSGRLQFFELLRMKRIVPADAVKRETRKRVRALNERQSEPLTKKEIRTVKDEIYLERLGKALQKETAFPVVIDTDTQQMWIGAASDGACSDIIKLIRRTGINIEPEILWVGLDLTTWMAAWMTGQASPPDGFSIGGQVKAVDPMEIKATVSIAHEELSQPDLAAVIERRTVVELELASESVSFNLTHDNSLKSIKIHGTPEAEDDLVHRYTLWALELKQCLSSIDRAVRR